MREKNNNSDNKSKRNKISESKVHQMRANLDKKNNSHSNVSQVNKPFTDSTRTTTNRARSDKRIVNKTSKVVRQNSDEVFDFEQEISKPLGVNNNKTSNYQKNNYSKKKNYPKTNTTKSNKIDTHENITYISDKVNSSHLQKKPLKNQPKISSSKTSHLNVNQPKKTQTKITKLANNIIEKNYSKYSKTNSSKPKQQPPNKKQNTRSTFKTNNQIPKLKTLKPNNLQNNTNNTQITFTQKLYKTVALVTFFVFFVAVGVWGYKTFFSSTIKKEVVATETKPKTKKTPKIPDCFISDLDLNVFLTENQIHVGQGTNFGISVTNRANKTCLAKAGSDKFGVRVMSGDQKIWDSVSCPVTSENNPLLLRPGQTWTGNIAWDGITYGAKCEKLLVSTAGTYKLLGVKNGDLLNTNHPFVLVK